MNKKQAVKSRFWQTNLVVWLPVAGQMIILVVVALATLWPAPVEANQLFAARLSSDLIFSQWPFALLIQRTFAQTHQLPFWNPYFGGGQPLAANPLAAFFYPPTLLVHFFSLRNYFLVLILGHLIFAGLGTLLLARRVLKLPYFPALVAAVSYMATPRLISHLGGGHVTIVQTVTWYPWLALACWATMREPRRWGAWLGICIALTLLAGHPQMAYYGLFMTGALAAWLLIKRWRAQGRRVLIEPLVGLAVAGITGVMLAAIQLLPLMELTASSTRQTALSSGDAIPLLNFLHSLLFLPSSLSSSWEDLIAPGLIGLVLALLAALACWRKVWPLLLGIGLVAGLAMGNASPLYWVVSRIFPGLDLFRGPARIWFIGLLLISLLAGVGVDVLLLGVRGLVSREGFSPQVGAALVLVPGLLAVFGVALSLIVVDVGYSHTGDINALTMPSALALSASRLAGSGRVYSEQENITQTDAVDLQMYLADGWDPLLLESYVRYMQQAGNYSHTGYTLHVPYDSPSVQPDAVLLGWMNVGVVVSQRPLRDPHLKLVDIVDKTLIYKNTADAGAAYMVALGPGNTLPQVDRLRRLEANVHIIVRQQEQETFAFSTPSAGYFVIATPAFPGWSASLDGHPVATHLLAGVVPAIQVSPGAHTLSYTYTPSYVRSGALCSAFALLLTLLWLLIGRRWKSAKSSKRFDKKPGGLPESLPLFR